MPRVLGTTGLGAIRGLVGAFSVGSTAFGPLLFAVAREATGSYPAVLAGSALLPLVVAGAALAVPAPTPRAVPGIART